MTQETANVEGSLDHDAEHIEEMRRHVRAYIAVFVALAAFTVITVAIAYVHLPVVIAVPAALLIAVIKGSLVACYFMHLIDERKLIYWVLLLTVVFFVVMMSLPMAQYLDPGPNEH